jgi:bifunctional DNA-binding transcriptional regulator/antitoxin component of YhaV-PrlF toxin-antitoxin module
MYKRKFNISIKVRIFGMPEIKEITKIFLSGRLSATLVIPIEIARRHGLEKPAHVIVEEKPEGILLRKLEI